MYHLPQADFCKFFFMLYWNDWKSMAALKELQENTFKTRSMLRENWVWGNLTGSEWDNTFKILHYYPNINIASFSL